MSLFRRTERRPRERKRSGRIPEAKSSTYSYYQKRSMRENESVRSSQEKTPPKRRTQRVIQHIPSLILVVVILVSLLYLSVVDPRVKIKNLDAQSNNQALTLRDEAEYQTAAESYIKKSIVNRSKFLIDSGGLSAELRKQFPELAAVTVTVPIMGRRPVLGVQTTRPAFVLVSGTQSVLIGNNGTALVDVKDVKNMNSLSVKTVNDESGLEVVPGKPALPKEQAQFIATIVEQLEKQSVKVAGLAIPQSPYDLHVRVQGKGYYVKFNVLEDPKQQAGSYLALKKKLEAEKGEPKEYIDVRVGERVFYR